MKRYLTGFRLLAGDIPFHPWCISGRSVILQQAFCHQPVFMLFDIILEELMSNNNIFSYQRVEVLYVIACEFPVMGNHFQCKIDCRRTGLALTKATIIIGNDIFVKLTKHFFYLFVQFFQFRSFTKFVKKNGIPFNFRYLKSNLVGINKYLQQFLDYEAAMINLYLVHEPGKATYIRNKNESLIFHFFLLNTFFSIL